MESEVAGGKLVVIVVAFHEEEVGGGRLSLAIFQLTP